jgi:UDP-2,4-diacetamido-2,4,6-trideoxy-beta-L-altropyranose hydrolase
MNILIRCDSSDIIGTGHVMRCLNLCENNSENNYTFVCKNFKFNIINKIKDKGYKLHIFEYTIEPKISNYKTWLGDNDNKEYDILSSILKYNKYDEIIIDHYGIDYNIESKLKIYCNVTVITDLFEYKHDCDKLINYNTNDIKSLIDICINPNTIIKYGIENIIINKKFLNKKKTYFRDKIKKICIMLGGSDPNNYTLKIIQTIIEYTIINDITIYIIIGKSNNNISSIKQFGKEYKNINILYDLNYDEIINIYLDIDLCIGSLSITTYERYFMNIPQICIKIANNQNILNIPDNILIAENTSDILNMMQNYINR